jgi:hypothetical protein
MSTDPKIAEALERLEAERDRRVSEKIERGEAVRVLLSAVATQDMDAVRARKLAEMRRNGETREVIWDEMVIDTGVPRAPDQRGESADVVSNETEKSNENNEALVSNEADKTYSAEPIKSDDDEPKRSMWTQTEQPSAHNPGGSISEGWYRVVEGGSIVQVWDSQKRYLGSGTVQPGQDPVAVGRRVLREKTALSDFDRRIIYPPTRH